MKLDMHCHTKEGSPDCKFELLENIRLLKEKGFHGMLITDHDSYKAYRYYKKLSEKPQDFVVLKGIEYDTIDAGHMIIVMPTGVKLPILELRGLPVLLLVEIVHHYGGIIGPAHPCGEKFLSIRSTLRDKIAGNIYRKFDFVEGYNACEDADSNMRAMRLAKEYDLPCFGGSDSHKPDGAGFGYTILQENITSETDLINYILSGKPTMVGGIHYEHTTKAKLGRVNKVLVYSFWLYNKSSALLRRKARNLELMENHIIESIRASRRNRSKYISIDRSAD
ncbi:MAG: PHP domain-containing protein [Lachnospiraceae bacterium]|nr:PHP domain-containing protein [Lachnospiraceae bacterium]